MTDQSQFGGTRLGRRRFLVGSVSVGGGLALGQLLAACGGDDDDGAGPSTIPTTDSSTGTAQRGGRLNIGVTDVPPSYALGAAGASWGASYQAFAWPLFHGSSSDDEEVRNALAAGYEVSEDLLTHTIELRPDITFHDGSPITAAAVVEVLRSQIFPDHPLRDEGTYNYTTAGFGSPPIVERVDSVDDLRLEVVLSAPRADIRRSITQHYIFNPAVMARSDYGTDPAMLADVGSGPFRVTNFSPSAFLELERYDDFFEEVRLDALRFENFLESSAMALALRAGDIDAAFGLSKVDHDDLAGDPNFSSVLYEPSFNVFFKLLPVTPELQDPRVREAIMLATNRPVYRDAFFAEGTAEATAQPGVHPERRGFIDNLEERPYDPERARALLQEAGAEGMTLLLTGYPSAPQIPEQASLLQAMQSDLQAVGIDAQLNITDVSTWVSTLYENHLWFSAYSPEASTFVYPLLFEAPGALGEWPEGDPRRDPRVEELLQAGLEAVDPEEQDRIFQELSQIEYNELKVYCPVAQVSSSLITRSGISELRVTTLGPDYQDAWIETS